MKGLGYALLVLFGAYVAFRYYSVTVTVENKRANLVTARPGVSQFCSQPIAQRPAQLWASSRSNACQSTEFGFAAAFGPAENNPQSIARLEI